MTDRPEPAEARAFVDALFGSALPTPGADLRVALWRKRDKRSIYVADAAAAARTVAGERDMYVCVSLAQRDLGPKHRVRSIGDVGVHGSAAIAGVSADIDVNGGPENKTGAAGSLDEALDLVRSIAEPTITVTSGHGLQAWWLLEDGAWVFRTVEERDRAARLASQWIALVDQHARRRGWKVDHTQDLARLMRLPDTVNGKGGLDVACRGWPTPVHEQDGPRYSVERLGELVHGVAPAGPGDGQLVLGATTAALDPTASPDSALFMALMDNSEKFRRTWRHTARDGVMWTMSEWDLSLASQAVQAEWTDQQITDLLAFHRRERGGEKLDRPDYFERTVAKARTQGRKADQVRDRDDALDDLEVIADQPAASIDPDATISAFNRVMGGPNVKEFVQDGRDPQTARFSLVLDNGEVVRLGRIRDVTDLGRFRDSLAVVTGHLLPSDIKRSKWQGAVQALLNVRVVRESVDDTPEGTVADWLGRYLYERIPPDPGDDAKDAACRRQEPFQEDDRVHVYASSFAAFVRQALRVNLPDHEVKDLLRAAGFERVTVHYVRDDDQPSTRSYYARSRDDLD